MTIQEIFKAQALNKYYAGVKEINLVEKMFPMNYSNDFDVTVLNDVNNGTVEILQFSNLDADPLARDFAINVHSKEGKKFFREKMSINEKQRMEFFQFLQSNDKEMLESYTLQLFESFAGQKGFLASVRGLTAYMAGQFLSTGKVIYTEGNGGGYTVDYKLSNDYKETLTSNHQWTNETTSDPIEDLNRWKTKLEENGKIVEIALLNKKTYNLLRKNNKVQALVKEQKLLPTETNFSFVIKELTGLDILIWEENVKVNGVIKKVFPDNVVTLIPNGNLGTMEYGPTPTKTDKLYGLAGDRDIVDITGTYAPFEVSQIKKASTVTNIELVIEANVAPNPTIVNNMFIATVG